jgi:hypothetical protein
MILKRLGCRRWGRQRPQRLENTAWPIMLEARALLVDPLGWQGLTSLGEQVSNGPQSVGAMSKIQHAQRIRPRQIDESLQPIGPIRHCPDLFGKRHSATPGLDFGQVREGRGVRQA